MHRSMLLSQILFLPLPNGFPLPTLLSSTQLTLPPVRQVPRYLHDFLNLVPFLLAQINSFMKTDLIYSLPDSYFQA